MVLSRPRNRLRRSSCTSPRRPLHSSHLHRIQGAVLDAAQWRPGDVATRDPSASHAGASPRNTGRNTKPSDGQPIGPISHVQLKRVAVSSRRVPGFLSDSSLHAGWSSRLTVLWSPHQEWINNREELLDRSDALTRKRGDTSPGFVYYAHVTGRYGDSSVASLAV
jgi:hypothetical protein